MKKFVDSLKPELTLQRFPLPTFSALRIRSLMLCLLITLLSETGSKAEPPQPTVIPYYNRVQNIVYKKHGKQPLRLDAYIPKSEGPFPAVLVVHGGAWMSGSKSQLSGYAMMLVRRGIACFAINYRLAPKYKHPAQIEDCRDAVRWIKTQGKHYQVDSSRIGAIGYSAGGHLVTMLAVTGMTRDEDPMGVGTQIQVALAGGAPCDLRHYQDLGFWLGDRQSRIPDVYRSASPITHVTSEDAPVFFYHGAQDRLVPVKGVLAMYELLQKNQIDSSLNIIPRAGHIGAVFAPKALESAFLFLQKHLDKQKPAYLDPGDYRNFGTTRPLEN